MSSDSICSFCNSRLKNTVDGKLTLMNDHCKPKRYVAEDR